MTTTHPVARAVLSLLLCAPAIAWSVDLLAGTPALVLAAATAPAALLAILTLVAQHGAHRPPAALAFAFFWGAAGAAFLSTTGNELSRTWIDPLSGGEARIATALVVAPVLEEAAKALGLIFILVVAPASLRTARDGIVYGALVGVGFVWTENFLYLGVAMLQAGQEGLVRALYLRGVLGGLTHAVFAACSGAAVGWWVSGGRRGAAPVSGVLLAIGQHMAWNAAAAPMIATALCGAVVAGGACTDAPTDAAVYGLATGIAAVFLAPGVALAAFAWRAADA